MATVTREYLQKFSLVKPDYKLQDPRQLAMLYPDSITRSRQSFIAFTKKVQTFMYNHSLDVATRTTNALGYILVPAPCLHWRRRTEYAERRVLVGRCSFYMMRLEEINDNEYHRLLDKIEEVRKYA